jgi:hypothetical protein
MAMGEKKTIASILKSTKSCSENGNYPVLLYSEAVFIKK